MSMFNQLINKKEYLHMKRMREENNMVKNNQSILAQSPQAHRNSKSDKIQKIMNNFTRMEELIKKEDLKKLFDNVAKFGFDDFAKLFQNVANKEFISLTSMNNNTKEPITLNMNMIKFNPENLEGNDFSYMSTKPNEDNIGIDQIIIKNPKEKNLIREKMSSILSSNSLNNRKDSNMTPSVLGTKEYFESITQNIKNILNDKVIDMPYLKNIIKLYSTFIHSNNKIVEQEDKLLLSLISEVFVLSSYVDFFELCNYWLYTEYLLSSEEKEYYRYDTLLNEIILLIENDKVKQITLIEETPFKAWVKFIKQIPRYNERFIDHLIMMHDVYFKTHYNSLKEKSYQKIPFIDQLPHLMPMRQIYVEIVNGRKINLNAKNDFMDKLLNKFIQMARNDYNHINARAIGFLFEHIYNISTNIDHYEEYRIRKFAIDGLKELLKITDDSTEDDHSKKFFIEQRFPLYLHLCGKENEVIDVLPEVYAKCSIIVKQIFDKYMRLMMNSINIFRAKQIANKCDEKCEEIIIAIIDICYKANVKIEGKIKDDGLFIKINNYYTKYYQLTKGLFTLCTRIPLGDFFSKDNFILTKLKSNNEEFSMKILDSINRNESPSVYDFGNIDETLLSAVSNKILLYIAYYYWYSKEISLPNNDTTVMTMLMKYYITKLIEKEGEELDPFNKFIIAVNYPIIAYIELFKAIIENVRMNKVNIEPIIQKLYGKIGQFLNEKIKISQDEFTDPFYEAFVTFIKYENHNAVLKEHLLKQLDETIKISLQVKDLITFGDL